MKKGYLYVAAIAMSAFMVACSGGGSGETATKTDAPAEPAMEEKAAEVAWNVNADESNIRWEGGTAGAQVYSHYGDVRISDGRVMTAGDKIMSGSFTVDMASIAPKDENYSEEHPASDLVGHLTTEDFFAVEAHPQAMFEITSMEGTTITGKLTVRGKSNVETIEVGNMEMSADGNTMTAMGTLIFDRQKYDVAWAHYLEDVVLSDDISLEIKLVANKG